MVNDDADIMANAAELIDDKNDEPNMIAMLDVLQTLGVAPEVACRFSSAVARNQPRFQKLREELDYRRRLVSSLTGTKPTFLEVYGQGRIVETANGCRRNLNLEGLHALDLRTRKSDGSVWNFDLASDRKLARQVVLDLKPTWLIGSPPCTAFSQLNLNLNFPRMKKADVEARVAEGRRHLRFVISLYQLQLEQGRHYLHEHPSGANSLSDDWMLRLLKHPRVLTVTSDQCQYGLLTTSMVDGRPLAAKKPTRWATTSPQMAKRLSRKCSRDHEHGHLLGGRAASAALYPEDLILEILRGMRDTADAESESQPDPPSEFSKATAAAGLFHDLPAGIAASLRQQDLDDHPKTRWTKFRMQDGSSRDIPLHEHFKQAYRDEYTNELLPRSLVESAIEE